MDDLKLKVEDLNIKVESQSTGLQIAYKEKNFLEKKLAQTNAKLVSCQSELTEERHISNALKKNQKEWQLKVLDLEVNNIYINQKRFLLFN